MKVFNLTDVSTPPLRRQGLAGCSIQVDGVSILPGTCAEVRDTPANRKYLQQSFVVRNAIAMDRLPKGYKGTAGQKKEEPPASSPKEKVEETPDPPKTEDPPADPPPDTQPTPGSEEEGKPKRKKRSSRRGS